MLSIMVLLFAASWTSLNAQLVSKNGKGSTTPEIQGNRNTDIEAFHRGIGQLQSAYLTKNDGQMQKVRTTLTGLANTELQRTRKNLFDLKTGKLSKNPNTGVAFNQRLEIQVLTNRLQRETYLDNRLKSFTMPATGNPRDLAGIRGNLNEFERLMRANLKYEKQAPVSHGNATGSQGTSSLKHPNTGGGKLISANHHPTIKPAKRNLPPSYFRHMENRQIASLNRMHQNRSKQAASLSSNLQAFVNKGNFDKAKVLFSEAPSIMRSDARANQKFLERAKKFQYIKVNTEQINNTIQQEKKIEQSLNNIKINNINDLKSNLSKITGLLNDFMKLKVDTE